jgi:uncharacterized protein
MFPAYKTAFPIPLSRSISIYLLSVFLAACSLTGTAYSATRHVIFMPSNVSLKAEVADTEAARERGLMHRTHLAANDGMIFYFDQVGYHAFYMYNTRIPLTVIFLNESLNIVDMRDMSPCVEKDPSACPVYAPQAACKYAIEVNQEFVRKHRIKKGNLVRIQK